MKKSAIGCSVYFLVLFLSSQTLIHAQALTRSSIYAHFVGVWSGTSLTQKDGVLHKEPVQITITEEEDRKGDHLRLDYIFGHKGDKDVYRDTKFMELTPSNDRLTLWQKGSDRDIYKITGFDDFDRTGYGKLVGLSRYSKYDQSMFPFAKQYPLTRFTVILTTDSLSYRWEMGSDEDHMKILSVYTLTRVPDGTS